MGSLAHEMNPVGTSGFDVSLQQPLMWKIQTEERHLTSTQVIF